MSTYEDKVKKFLNEVDKCQYELPDELKPILIEALKSAGFNQMTTSSVKESPESPAGKKTKGKKTKGISGYNLFMREKSAELKTQNVPSSERLSKVGGLWKAMTDVDKKDFNDRAKSINAESGVSNSPSPAPKSKGEKAPKKTTVSKPTGYQLFVKEKMAELKGSKDVPGNQRMTKIGAMWKAVDDKEKETWKEKAKNLPAVSDATEDAPEDAGEDA